MRRFLPIASVFLLLTSAVCLEGHQENVPDIAWRFVTGGRIQQKPAIDHRGTVYIASNDRKLYAVLSNGIEKWSFGLGSRPTTAPLVTYDGTILVGSEEGVLYALAPNGRMRWRFPALSGYCLNPALGSDGTIYLPTRDGTLYALAFNGTVKWRYQTKAAISSSLSIGPEGTLYFTSADRRLHALGPSGKKKWEATLPGQGGTPAIGKDGTLYVNSFGLQAISRDGKLLWHYSIPARTADPVIGSRGVIFVGAHNARLYAIDPRGRKLWDVELGDAVGSAAALSEDETIFVGTLKKRLYAVSPRGEILWRFEAKKTIRIPTLSPGGTLYVGADDWILYALEAGHGGPGQTPWPLFLHDIQHTGRYSGLRDLTSPAYLILREMAYSDSRDLKMAALGDIDQYVAGERFLPVHIRSLEEILGYLAGGELTRRSYQDRALFHEDLEVRISSCRLLGRLGTDGARNILLDLLRQEKEEVIKLEALKGLGRIGTDPEGRVARMIAAELEPEKESLNYEPFVLAALDALSGISERRRSYPEPEVLRTLVRITQGDYSERVRREARAMLDSFIQAQGSWEGAGGRAESRP